MKGSPLPEGYVDLVLDPLGSPDGVRLALGMIASVDGAIAHRGRSAALGGVADRAVLTALREAADVVLVGAATLRTEGYEAVGGSEASRERRMRKGLAPVPRLAVVTSTGDLPPNHPLLGGGEPPAIVVTTSASLQRVREQLRGLGYLRTAELVIAGEERLDARRIRDRFLEHDLRRLLCEGGPTLAGQLLDQDAIDEVFVTISPHLIGGEPRGLTSGAEEELRTLRLIWCEMVGDEVLLRYERMRR